MTGPITAAEIIEEFTRPSPSPETDLDRQAMGRRLWAHRPNYDLPASKLGPVKFECRCTIPRDSWSRSIPAGLLSAGGYANTGPAIAGAKLLSKADYKVARYAGFSSASPASTLVLSWMAQTINQLRPDETLCFLQYGTFLCVRTAVILIAIYTMLRFAVVGRRFDHRIYCRQHERQIIGDIMTRQQILDLYFIDARCKLIELAAFLDRVERSEGEADFRLPAFRAAHWPN